jgi:hypothetical protein
MSEFEFLSLLLNLVTVLIKAISVIHPLRKQKKRPLPIEGQSRENHHVQEA